MSDADPEPVGPADPASTSRTSRRTVLAAIGGALAGGVLVSLMRPTGPSVDDDALPTAEFSIGALGGVVERIRRDGPLLLPDEGSARLAVVLWDPSYVSEAGSADERYGPAGEDHPVVDQATGVMVLALVSTHLGCRARFCDSSQWFEDPCHGARWNRWGEWTGGPAPRGLDRHRSRVTEQGNLTVSLTEHIVGPARENGVFDQPPHGPACVDG